MRTGRVKHEGVTSSSVTTLLLSSNIKLTTNDTGYLYYDPNGLDRLVELPDIPVAPTELNNFKGIKFVIRNVGTTNNITVQDDALNTLAVINTLGTQDGEEVQCVYGDEWHVTIL